jgi:hypothetical protein
MALFCAEALPSVTRAITAATNRYRCAVSKRLLFIVSPVKNDAVPIVSAADIPKTHHSEPAPGVSDRSKLVMKTSYAVS